MHLKLLFFTCSCFSMLAISCSKEKTGALMLGEWKFSSQSDVVGGVRGYFVFTTTPPRKIKFSGDGKAYTEGIVTPTWILTPTIGYASYHVKDNILTIGDSTLYNGNYVYTTARIQFAIVSISKKQMILQHIYRSTDPAPPITIDTLIR